MLKRFWTATLHTKSKNSLFENELMLTVGIKLCFLVLNTYKKADATTKYVWYQEILTEETIHETRQIPTSLQKSIWHNMRLHINMDGQENARCNHPVSYADLSRLYVTLARFQKYVGISRGFSVPWMKKRREMKKAGFGGCRWILLSIGVAKQGQYWQRPVVMMVMSNKYRWGL